MGCIDVPALPLQLLLQTHPDWRPNPVAVLAEERLQSPILHVNRRAAHAGVQPGLRYSAGLSLCGELRAGTVSPEQIGEAVQRLTRILQAFTPHVEPAADAPGVLWLDLSSLHRLWRDPELLSNEIRKAVKTLGFAVHVVIGHSRFGTYAVAKSSRKSRIFPDADQEQAAAMQTPLDSLIGDPQLSALFKQLAIHTVADLLRLPSGDILPRFGPEVYALHREAAGAWKPPLEAQPQDIPLMETIALEDAVSNVTTLLFFIKRGLIRLFAMLARRGDALASATFRLELEGQPSVEQSIHPAAPTLDQAFVLELIRLRLGSLALSAGVTGIVLKVKGSAASPQQLRLFTEGKSRDRSAGDRVLAEIRAKFGEGAAVKPVLREGHLPEAQFGWEPMEYIPEPNPQLGAPKPRLIRRMYTRPASAPPPVELQDGKAPPAKLPEHPVLALMGPDRISGGWWHREITRDYYYAKTRSGELLWIYYDHQRQRWFVQGRVE